MKEINEYENIEHAKIFEIQEICRRKKYDCIIQEDAIFFRLGKNKYLIIREKGAMIGWSRNFIEIYHEEKMKHYYHTFKNPEKQLKKAHEILEKIEFEIKEEN